MKPTTIIFFSDMHTTGTTALFPNVRRKGGKFLPLTEQGGWRYINNPHYYPSDLQIKIWNHLEKCLDIASAARKGERLILLNTGDAIEGIHHGSVQTGTFQIQEQKDTHIELMLYIKERLNFQRGDVLMYVTGTGVHVGDEETGIAAQLGAQQYSDGFYSVPFIELEINKNLFWVYHHGIAAGRPPNRGNAAYNKLKQIYYQCLEEGDRIPRCVVSGHTHDPLNVTYQNGGVKMDYIILPSWQDKTKYANEKIPTSINKIGMQIVKIDGNGELKILNPILMKSPLGERIQL